MIRSTLLYPDGTLIQENKDLSQQCRQNPGSFCWLDLLDEDPDCERRLLLDLDCHPLAIQDAQRDRHPPKVEIFEEHTFLLYRGIGAAEPGLVFEQLQIALFVSENLLITRHARPSVAIETWWQSAKLNQFLHLPFLLAVKIMHTSFGLYLDNILDFEQLLGEKEEAIQESTDDVVLRELTVYKARLRKLRRVFNYHERVAATLLDFVKSDAGIRYADLVHEVQDLNDRADRIASLLSMYYEICGDLIEGYLSLTSHQLNRTMQILTVVTTIFVPLGFLAGIYGMNFENIPELHHQYGYFILLGVMGSIGAGALILFKWKRWI